MELSTAMDLSPALEATPSLDRSRFDRETARLIGSRCEQCGTVSWPARAICHHCGSADVRELVLSPEGDLVTYTTVWVSRPGLTAPYTLGQVDLPEGVRVFAHIRGLAPETLVPHAVHLVPAEEESSIPPFWFEPTEAV
jgi:uncharacterized OB-fold protein